VVSVILPTYNHAGFIPKSISSVLSQSWTDLELIIVDDGSTDNTEELVRSVSDPRLSYYKFPHEGHTGRLKNFAIAQSRGDLVAFIDADDFWVESKLEKQVNAFAVNPEMGFSVTDVIIFEEETIQSKSTYKRPVGFEITDLFSLLKQSRFLIYPSSLVIRKSCLNITGYFDETLLSGDYNFNMRLAYHFKAGVFFESLVWRRIHPSNLSHRIRVENYQEYTDTFRYLYANKMVEKKYLNKALRNSNLKLGDYYLKVGEVSKARKEFLKALQFRVIDPKPIMRFLNTYVK
jgi:glycosyltransferase involved in cell wall biosynthesis